jgi:hypothetical protein
VFLFEVLATHSVFPWKLGAVLDLTNLRWYRFTGYLFEVPGAYSFFHCPLGALDLTSLLLLS